MLISFAIIVFQINPPSPVANYEPLEMVGSSDDGNATAMISVDDLPYQPMNVDLPPPQEGNDVACASSLLLFSIIL